MIKGNRQSELQSIFERYAQLLVFSPHMDDAVLSCGGFMSTVSQRMKCATVTLCTSDPDLAPHESPPHGIALPSERRHEEAAAMKALGSELIQLDFVDAIYRKDRHGDRYLYPTLDSLWSMPVEGDGYYRDVLTQKFKTVLRSFESLPTLILTPAGVGHHVDHILCTQTLLSLVPDLSSVMLYEDFPYVVDQGEHVGVSDSIEAALRRLHVRGVERVEFHSDIDAKASLILNYPSQLDTIFGGSTHIRSVLAKSGVEETAVERFWLVEPVT
ncbi:MAG: hypothetical protein RJB13_828 [Pseudomonadota bacterium]